MLGKYPIYYRGIFLFSLYIKYNEDMMDIDFNKEHWEHGKCPKYDCKKDACKCGLKKIFLASVLGDDSKDSPIAPKNGAYCNAIVVYEVNSHVYIYSSEGIPTLVESGGNYEEIIELLNNKIEQEASARTAADKVLQDEIDDIKNSPDVVDIVATYAALQAYDTSKLGDNDVIRVLADEQHDGQSTYYRWDKNNSTWVYIGAVGDYYTKGQVDTLLSGKQDTLTAGANISISQVDDDLVISATDTTYSNFTGTDGVSAGTAGLVPAPATTDAGKFLKADGTWETVSAGPTVVQTTGTSTTDVMSQNAVTGMIYASGYDPSTGSSDGNRVAIGGRSTAGARTTIAIGAGRLDTSALAIDSVALGEAAAVGNASYRGSVALGSYAVCTAQGQVQIGSTQTSDGYNSSNYRLLSGLYDGQSAHDAATYGQVISYSAINGAGAPTTATEGKYVGQLYYDTTNEDMYFLKTIDTTTTPATYTWEALGGGSSVNVVQTNGTSTTDVMSQKAVTDLLFNNNLPQKVQIGGGADSSFTGNGSSIAIGTGSKAKANNTIAIGNNASSLTGDAITLGRDSSASANNSVAIGRLSSATGESAVALGARATATQKGQFDISTGTATWGYNNSSYRLLTGLYDPQSAHDAVTKGYVDAISSYSETEADTGAAWIDGKTIYKKSYQQTITGNSQQFNLNITNLYEIVKIEAIWHVGGTLTNGLPTTFATTSSLNDAVTVLTYGGTAQITSSGRNGMKGVITFYYTKSS